MNFRYALTYLPILGGAAVFGVFALVLWLTSRRALANSRGGLDWVKNYRADGFDLSEERLTRYGHDWLYLFAVAVISALLSVAMSLMRSHYETGSWFEGFFTVKTACKLVFYTVGACSVCWLLQDLLQDDTVALCGGIVFAASFVGSHTSVSLLAVSLLLFLNWFSRDDTATLFPGVFLLLASYLVIGAAASRMLGLIWVAAGYGVATVYKCLRRCNSDSGRLWEVFLVPALALIIWTIGYLVAEAGVLVLSGARTLSDIPQWGSHVMLRALWRAVSSPKRIISAPIYKGLLVFPLSDAPILMLGFFGFFAAIGTARDRHEPADLISALLLVLLGIAWVFSREYCLLPGLLLCAACLLRRFTAAEKTFPVIIYTVLSCIYYLMLYVVGYLLEASPVIVETLY